MVDEIAKWRKVPDFAPSFFVINSAPGLNIIQPLLNSSQTVQFFIHAFRN